MIKGTGIDIIEIARIQRLLAIQPKLIDRVLTGKEQQLFYSFSTEKRKIEFLAGRYAAKEAFSKAWGTGIGELSFLDIEILFNKKKAPILTSSVLEGQRCFVSISHSERYAVAQVIIESESAY